MAPQLQLRCLGAPLLLTDSGEQVRFRTSKHFALLIRLALEPGKKFTRDYLVDLLWADAPAPLASHSLAQALSVVKARVGREHLHVQRATVALADSAVGTDVSGLDACDVEIRGRFLNGFEIPGAASFEQWKDEWSAKLMSRIRDCLVRQMDGGRRIGDFTTVERHARVLHELDPLSEDAVRGLMEARAWVGDRSNALKVYARFQAQLAEELGAKPSVDLERVASLLREGRGTAPRRAVHERPERAEKRFNAETLIGREREFGALYDAWLAVRKRAPRIVVLTGDPGVGKTTLTNAFVSTCQMEGAVVARAQAYDAERELPFAILAELVKQLTLQRAIGSAEPEALAELSRICADIFSAFPGVPKPVDWSAEVTPLRLADAFLKAVGAAAEESPVVLVVDDIHAADNASAAILHIVARKLPHTRLLLILAGRSSELRSSAAPAALCSDTSVDGLGTLELDPLSPDAAKRLVATLVAEAGMPPSGLPTERIIQASRGNPLAIELLTREWQAHGASSLLHDLELVDTQPVASLGIPRAIRIVFERQIQRLDPTIRAVMDLAAVLGRRLSDLLLYDTVNLASGRAAEALSRLREEGVLREVHGSLEFRNELIRAQAYYTVAGPARQQLHRRVADQLAARAPEDGQPAKLEIAWHYLRGGDSARALPYAMDGAEAALKVGAPYEAEQILMALLQGHHREPSMQRIRLLLAKALLDQSKADAAVPILQPLVNDATLSLRETAEATRMQASAEFLLNRATGLCHSEAAARALTAARQTDDVELVARALFEYARSGVEAGDEARVRAAQNEILDLLKKPSAGKLPIVSYTEGYCHYFFYDVRLAAECMRKSIELLDKSTNIVELSLACTGLGNCKIALCEFRGARDAYLAGLELARKVGDDSRASIITSNVCALENIRGEYRTAIEYGLRSVDLGTGALNQPMLVGCYVNLAEAYTLTGDRAKAIECLERARNWLKRERSWWANVEFLCQSALIAIMMGNLNSALELVASAERAAWGRERVIPNIGVFEKLKVFRAAHIAGSETALAIASQARAKFRDRHPYYYLDAVAATAWVEKRTLGYYTPETQKQLELFRTLEVEGFEALLKAQGFLT